MGSKTKKAPKLSGTAMYFGLETPSPDRPLRAVIDVGSNTVRLDIWAYPYRGTEPVIKLKAMPGLAKDLNGSGFLNKEARLKTIEALKEYMAVLADLKKDGFLTDNDIASMATAALRDADNGQKFLGKIKKETGLDLNLISGPEEAFYIGLGLADKKPEGKALGLDLGGGSLEIVKIKDGKIKSNESVPLGTWRVRNMKSIKEEKIAEILAPHAETLEKAKTVTLMGGTWRKIMKSYRLRHNFNNEGIDDFEVDALELLQHARILEMQKLVEATNNSLGWNDLCDDEALKKSFEICQDRAAHIPAARLLLETMIEAYGIEKIAMTTSNTRYGRMIAMDIEKEKPEKMARLKEKHVPDAANETIAFALAA